MERGAVMQHRHPDETEKSTMAHDVRFALRVLARSPVLTTITILALTVGIGLPTVMFSIVNGVFRDVPIAEPERVMSLFTTDESAPGRISSVSHHDFVAWRDQLQGFSALAGFTIEDVTIGGGDVHPNREDAAFVTSGVFAVLRTQPMLGRPFRDEDAMPGASPVVMISHGLWQSRFGGDSAVITRSLVIDGREHAIVGVMRPGFVFPGNEPIWIPLALSTTGPREDASTLSVVGRLREGGSLEAVRAELAVVAGRLAAAYPESNRGRSATARPYGEGIVAPVFTRGLFTMLGAVSLVLLIACINVAHLALARAIHRSREIAVRTAMGASRRRVVSQFFVESLIVTMVGGVLGTIAAAVGAHAVGGVVVSAAGVPWGDPGLDGTVLMFVLAAVIVSSVLAAVLPALHAARLNVNAVLKDAPRGVAGGGAGIGRFGRWLVVAEIAASCALLAVRDSSSRGYFG
jgi:predicted permease